MTRSRCGRYEPNDWITYVDWRTGAVVHVDLFFSPKLVPLRRNPPPGGWSPLPADDVA